MTTLQRLANWYSRQCKEEWEHQCGIKIESCDNPGWWIKIELQGTGLANSSFDRRSENVDQQGFQKGPRWIDCRIIDGVWNGAGDETRLEEIVEEFLSWADSNNS